MNGNAPSTQVVDPQYATDNIATKVIENEDFPYWISVRGQDRACLWYQPVGGRRLMMSCRWLWGRAIKVQNLFQGG